MDEVRGLARKLAEKRRDGRRDFERYAEQAANAEQAYHKTKAIEFAKARSSGQGVKEAEILANGRSADERHRRDIAQSLAKSALLRIDELEADRAMLRQLGDWSQRMEGVVA